MSQKIENLVGVLFILPLQHGIILVNDVESRFSVAIRRQNELKHGINRLTHITNIAHYENGYIFLVRSNRYKSSLILKYPYNLLMFTLVFNQSTLTFFGLHLCGIQREQIFSKVKCSYNIECMLAPLLPEIV